MTKDEAALIASVTTEASASANPTATATNARRTPTFPARPSLWF